MTNPGGSLSHPCYDSDGGRSRSFPHESVEAIGEVADHVAYVHEAPTEQRTAPLSFLQNGLENGKRCLYFAGAETTPAVKNGLRERGVDVEEAMERGDLSILNAEEAYSSPGALDPDELLEFWERFARRTADSPDYTGFRATGEMAWAINHGTEHGSILEYEARLNSIDVDTDRTILCQYNRHRISDDVLAGVLETHPYVLLESRVVPNVYYTPPDDYLGEDTTATIDRRLETLQHRAKLEQQLVSQRRWFQELSEALTITKQSHAESVGTVLEVGCERFGLETGLLLEANGDGFTVAASAGRADWECGTSISTRRDSYWARTVRREHPLGVSNVSSNAHADPLAPLEGIESYLGCKVPSTSGCSGLLCFMDREQRPSPFDDIDYTFLEVMAQWLGYELLRNDREAVFRNAHEIMSDSSRSLSEQIEGLLELGRQSLGIEYATFSRVDEAKGEYVFQRVAVPEEAPIEAGVSAQLETLPNCARVVETEESVILRDVAQQAPELDDAEWGIASYLGTPVSVDDEVYGTFCFYDMEPRRRPFSEWEVTFVELMGDWVGDQLERQRSTDRQEAVETLNEIIADIALTLADDAPWATIERTVCESLVDSDLYKFAWVDLREATEAIVTGPERVERVPEGDASDEDTDPSRSAGEMEPSRSHVEYVTDNSTEDDGWRSMARDHGVEAIASIPIATEERHFGTLTVCSTRAHAFTEYEWTIVEQLGTILGLVLGVLDQRQELEFERQQLELVNQLVRHDLLNSLNVVEARSDMLVGNVSPEAESHLRMVRDRVEGMIDLIETVRGLITIFSEESTHELEEIDLVNVVETEVQRAQQTHTRAEFSLSGDLNRPRPVMADDLLSAVFDNLLNNAVEHNESETPRVHVEVERGPETTAVHVADNGAGVPDDVRDTLFEQGEKGSRSGGTGLGLYLVREIVEAYDGSVSVSENDPQGAVFTVTLPNG